MRPVAVCPFAGDEHGTRPASAPQGHAASRWRGRASLDRLPPARSELSMQTKADCERKVLPARIGDGGAGFIVVS